ncbi:hypothetical protein GGI43DRAFT_49952 [Trichoderma evansii]
MQTETIDESLLSFRDPERIVGIKLSTYVYPHADGYIGPEHRQWFAILVEIFQQHLHKHTELCLEHSTRTEFQLKMCGGHRLTAEPSIIIAHPSDDPDTGLAILKTLTQTHIRDQYEHHSTTRFQIYLSLRSTFEYLAPASESLSICIKNSYFSGAILASGNTYDNVSTITCGIRFSNTDDTIFALTPAHAFRENGQGNGKSTQKGISSLLSMPSENKATCVLADVEYDMAELRHFEKGTAEAIVQHEYKLKLANRHGDSDVQIPRTEIIMPRRVWGRPGQSNAPNLDWALVEIDPSHGITAADDARQVFDLGDEKRAVQIITPRGLLQGMIRRTLTFITNSGSDSPFCEVWKATISGPIDGDVRMGDSGSLVIDSITNQPCGYVIAVNRLQELYVVPLCSVLRQIAEMVSIPNVKPEVFLNLEPNQRPIQAQGPVFRVLMTYFSQIWSRTSMEELRPAWLRKLRAKCAGGWSYIEMGVCGLLSSSIPKLSTFYRLASHNQHDKFSDASSTVDYVGEYGDNDSKAIHPLDILKSPTPEKLPSYGWPITADNDPINSYGHRVFPGNPIMDVRVYDQDPSIFSPRPARLSDFRAAATFEDTFQIIQYADISENIRRPLTPFEPANEISAASTLPSLAALEEEELPLLLTSLSRRKQRKILTQASRHLSTCILEFCNRHELPNTVIQGMDPGEQPLLVRNLGRKKAPDLAWGEFVFLLGFLIAEEQIPAKALYSDLAVHFRVVLRTSLGVDDILRHPEPPRDDRTILRILSAGVQVARMLNDLDAMNKLDELLMKTERTMIEANV